MAENSPRKPPETLPITDEARRRALRAAQSMSPPMTIPSTVTMMIVEASALPSTAAPPTASFFAGDYLCLRFEDNPVAVLINPAQGITLGRQAPVTGTELFVDLTPFGGYPLGVSRQHAFLQYSPAGRVELRDLGSSNGTYLNGNRLPAHDPIPISNGDMIHLGQMEIIVVFYLKADIERVLKK